MSTPTTSTASDNAFRDDLVPLLECPESGGPLIPVRIGGEVRGLFSPQAALVFPVTDGIPILLPRKARNRQLEEPLIVGLINDGGKQISPEIGAALDNTIALLAGASTKSWEWEDEEHWTQVYSSDHAQDVQVNWNDRLWERERMVNCLLAQTSLAGKVLVDVGCGEGHVFRMQMLEHCRPDTVYIGADISLAALRLNRSRNHHPNKFYILATADRVPLRPQTIDVLCYLGILHHAEHKAATLGMNRDQIKPGGFLMLHEALARPYFGWLNPFRKTIEASAHEERIEPAEMEAELTADKGFRILTRDDSYTVWFGVMHHLFPKMLVNSKPFFKTVWGIDRMLVGTLGKVLPPFRAGQIHALAQRVG